MADSYVKLPKNTTNGNVGGNNYYLNLPITSVTNGSSGTNQYYLRLPTLGAAPPPPPDPNAAAFIAAAMITDPTQQAAINQLVVSLKAAGIWPLLDAVYPIVGGTAFSHSFNLVNPALFQLTFFGGPTQSANGVQGNAINQYALTGYSPAANQTLNNGHMSCYSRLDIPDTGNKFGLPMGCSGTSGYNQSQYIAMSVSSNALWGGKFNDDSENNDAAFPGLPTTGLIALGRITSQNSYLYRNGTELIPQTVADPSNTMPGLQVALMAINQPDFGINNYSSYQFAYFSMGQGFTPTQNANYYTIVQAYQTALGRQV